MADAIDLRGVLNRAVAALTIADADVERILRWYFGSASTGNENEDAEDDALHAELKLKRGPIAESAAELTALIAALDAEAARTS